MEDVKIEQPAKERKATRIAKQVFFFYLLPFIGFGLMIALFGVVEDYFGFHEDLSKIIRLLLMGFYAMMIFFMIRRKKDPSDS